MIKNFLAILIISFFVFNGSVNSLNAQGFQDGLDKTAATAYVGNAEDINGLKEHRYADIAQSIGFLIYFMLLFIGVLLLGLLIYGGYKWMIAQGNEQEVTKAKNTIKQAIIGLIIILSAYAITSYMYNYFYSSPAGVGEEGIDEYFDF